MIKKYKTEKYMKLFDKPYQELLDICAARNIYVDTNYNHSKTEIIMMLAMDECTPQQDLYRITVCDDQYFVKLTNQQVSFFHWLNNQNILPSDGKIEKFDKITYEEA